MEEGELRRGSRRRRVMLSARLVTSSGTYDVRIRDVSATGARVEGPELPRPDTVVMMKRGAFSTYGQLIWVDEGTAGIIFDEPFDEDELLEALNARAPVAPPPQPLKRPGFGRATSHPRYSDGHGWLDSRSGRG